LRAVQEAGTFVRDVRILRRHVQEQLMSSISITDTPASPRERAIDGTDVVRSRSVGSTGPVGLGGVRPRRARRGPTGPHGEEAGFTLVELLVVVLVIGALVAIAVPTFVGQRERAFDAAVTSELRAASIALESYRAQNGGYSLLALQPGAGWGYESSGTLDLRSPTVTATSYCLIAQHVSTSNPNLNTTWRVRDDTSVERIETGAGGTCTSQRLTD
jgi:type IV pilus assembly protein PilA